MTKSKRQLKLIDLKPAAPSKIKDARKGSKIAILIGKLDQENGATLEQLAKAMSKTGSDVSASYVKAWIHYDLHKLHGYGVKSTRDDDGKVRCYLVRPKVRVRKPAPITGDNVVQLTAGVAA